MEGDVAKWISFVDRDCLCRSVQDLEIEDVGVDESENILVEYDGHDGCYWDCVVRKVEALSGEIVAGPLVTVHRNTKPTELG